MGEGETFGREAAVKRRYEKVFDPSLGNDLGMPELKAFIKEGDVPDNAKPVSLNAGLVGVAEMATDATDTFDHTC